MTDTEAMTQIYCASRALYPVLPPRIRIDPSPSPSWDFFRSSLSTPDIAVFEWGSPTFDPWTWQHEIGHAWQWISDYSCLNLGMGGQSTIPAAWKARGFTVSFEEAWHRYRAEPRAASAPWAWSPVEWIADAFACATYDAAAQPERILARGGLFSDPELAAQPPFDPVAMRVFFATWPPVAAVLPPRGGAAVIPSDTDALAAAIRQFWAEIGANPDAPLTHAQFQTWAQNFEKQYGPALRKLNAQ